MSQITCILNYFHGLPLPYQTLTKAWGLKAWGPSNLSSNALTVYDSINCHYSSDFILDVNTILLIGVWAPAYNADKGKVFYWGSGSFKGKRFRIKNMALSVPPLVAYLAFVASYFVSGPCSLWSIWNDSVLMRLCSVRGWTLWLAPWLVLNIMILFAIGKHVLGLVTLLQKLKSCVFLFYLSYSSLWLHFSRAKSL